MSPNEKTDRPFCWGGLPLVVVNLEFTGVVPSFFWTDLFLNIPVFDDLATFQAEKIEKRPVVITLFHMAVDHNEFPY